MLLPAGTKAIEAGVRFVSVTIVQPPGSGRTSGTTASQMVCSSTGTITKASTTTAPCAAVRRECGNRERYGLPHPRHDAQPRPLPSRCLRTSGSAACWKKHSQVITEMGRTPRMNQWASQITGAVRDVDRVCRSRSACRNGHRSTTSGDVIDRRYTPADYAETIYHKSYQRQLLD